MFGGVFSKGPSSEDLQSKNLNKTKINFKIPFLISNLQQNNLKEIQKKL